MILNFIYLLWLGGATLLGVLENIFMLFVGVAKPHEMGGYLDPNDASDTNWGQDITSRVLGYRATQDIFFNLVAFATVMLIFFTIIQIIREHYKDKHGGNPYVLVFRMVKAMVLFMFVTAACVIGLRLSNIVLQALIDATGGGKNIGIGGIIFVAMAGQANRISQYSEGDLTNIDNREKYAAMSALDRQKDWTWLEFPNIWYGGNPDDLYEDNDGGEDTTLGVWCDPMYLSLPSIAPLHGGTALLGLFNSPKERGTGNYAGSRLYQIIKFDTGDLHQVRELYVKDSWVMANSYTNSSVSGNPIINDSLSHINVTATNGKIHRAPRYGPNKSVTREQKGFFFLGAGRRTDTDEKPLMSPTPPENNRPYPVLPVWEVSRSGTSSTSNGLFSINENPVGSGSEKIFNDSTWGNVRVWSEDYSSSWHYYALTTNNRGRPISARVRAYGMMSGSYYYFQHEKSMTSGGGATLRNHYERNVASYIGKHGGGTYHTRNGLCHTACAALPGGGVDEKTAQNGYATWVDNMMKRTRGVAKEEDSTSADANDGYLYYLNDQAFLGIGRDQKIGYMTYTNVRTVTFLYDIKDFNWIIGFGGLFIALGVFNSFAFGMIQRVAELAILYMFAPVTLAFFPFDDGAQFNNAFVKPFYKKAISSYAPVLSLNLFFAILPAFSNIDWVNPSSPGGFVMNGLISCIVTIALLSMLPKVRTTIQTMLGADPMDEKKMFGKGGIMANAIQKSGAGFVAGKVLPKYGIQKGMSLSSIGTAANERKKARDDKRKKKVDDAVAAADRAHRAKTGGKEGLSSDAKAKLAKEMSATNKLGMRRRSARDAMKKAENAGLDVDVAQRRGQAVGMKNVQQRDPVTGELLYHKDKNGNTVAPKTEKEIASTGALARIRQRAENANAARDKTIFGNDRHDMQNMNAADINKNKDHQRRAFEAIAKSTGLSDEKAKKWADEQMAAGKKVSDRMLDSAHKGGKDGAGVNALQNKNEQMGSKVDKLQREVDAQTVLKNKTDVVNAMGGQAFDDMVAKNMSRGMDRATATKAAVSDWLVKNKGMNKEDAAKQATSIMAAAGDSASVLKNHFRDDARFQDHYDRLKAGNPGMTDAQLTKMAASETLKEKTAADARIPASEKAKKEYAELLAQGRVDAVTKEYAGDSVFNAEYARMKKENPKATEEDLVKSAAAKAWLKKNKGSTEEEAHREINALAAKGDAAVLKDFISRDAAVANEFNKTKAQVEATNGYALTDEQEKKLMERSAKKVLEAKHAATATKDLDATVQRELDGIMKGATTRANTEMLKAHFKGDTAFETMYNANVKTYGEDVAARMAAETAVGVTVPGGLSRDQASAAVDKLLKDGSSATGIEQRIKSGTLAQGVSDKALEEYGKEWLAKDGADKRTEVKKADVLSDERVTRQKKLDDAAYPRAAGIVEKWDDETKLAHGFVQMEADGKTPKRDSNGKMIMKTKDTGLREAYDAVISKDNEHSKAFREQFGIENAFTHDAKGIAGEALRVAGNVAKFATNPWYAVDTMQGWANKAKDSTETSGSLLARGLSHIPGIGGALADKIDGKGISFGAIAGALFEPGYGALATTGFGKAMDQYSRYQMNKGYDELEKNRMERMEPDAFADSRVLRQAGVYYEREQTMRALNEGVENVKSVYGGGDRDTQVRNYEAAETKSNQAIEASANVRLGGINEAEKRRAVIDKIETAAKEYDEGTARENFRRNQYDAINKGTVKELEGIFGPALATSIVDARQRVNNDATKKEILEQHHETISSFQKVESLVRKDDGTLKTVQDLEADVAKRKSQLDEYAGIAGRVLGINEQTQAVLNAAKAKIVDFDGHYQKALKAVQDKQEPYTMPDGTVIRTSGQLKPLQEATYAEYERVVRANVDFGAAASRDYAEKVGDRLDGYKGGKMAAEQTKLMQETVKSSHRDTHQIFCDPEFVKLLESSRWAEIAAQLRKASNGEECVFDRQTVAAAKKHELMGFANMFNDMMGDADGEMRGGSFAVANNMIAKQLRIAFVDQIDKSLEATANLIDREQETAFRQRNEQIQNGINKLSSGLGWEKDVYSSVNFQALDSLSFSDGAQITKMQKDMLAALEQSRRSGEIKDEYAYNNARRDIELMFSATIQNLSKRHEGNLMLWRRRELRELDYVARCMMDRKDDKRAALPGGDNWFS